MALRMHSHAMTVKTAPATKKWTLALLQTPRKPIFTFFSAIDRSTINSFCADAPKFLVRCGVVDSVVQTGKF